MKTVGADEAKTYLPQLLEDVAAGAEVVITKHGQPVAMLVPISIRQKLSVQEAISGLRSLRSTTQPGGTIQELIAEGRRF
ncbi:type II toxin-antitoxin system prevent-host-death family antitoxin [Romeria aff. gracilis LEGE 07310]|uniref:Antitoxin n=1 Tax=Vasconcelosia minhoensis LEGE 07310 TaxID=915328 RepID=A0A8J7A4M5_9CYAN|nr:type II toxin-antitoxin system prevent-host-death family antitoxin [Romeria gracilis]MBE9075760.1 type II toxin-antitoxin system prevent-host-death family antitoxin [Romeria aff. gracilis LEGE 07310]